MVTLRKNTELMGGRQTPMMTGWPSEEGARDYLETHRILELLDNMTAQLVFHRPAEPKEFLIDHLTQLKAARKTKRDYPCIFDDGNIQAMFRMLDPEGRGYITATQLKESLQLLGIDSESALKSDTDRVSLDMFMRLIKIGLVKASATVSAAV